MANGEQYSERRTHERYHLKRSFDVVNCETGRVLGRLADISIQGMMVLSANKLRADTICQVSLRTSEADTGVPEIRMGLDCMWSLQREDTGCWAGFRIIDISDEAMEQLQQLISAFGEPE